MKIKNFAKTDPQSLLLFTFFPSEVELNNFDEKTTTE